MSNRLWTEVGDIRNHLVRIAEQLANVVKLIELLTKRVDMLEAADKEEK